MAESLPGRPEAGCIEDDLKLSKYVPLFSGRVRVPAPGQVGRKTACTFEILLLEEQARDHCGDFAYLDVRQAQLTEKPVALFLVGERRELVSGGRRKEVLFLKSRVLAQSLVKFLDGGSGVSLASCLRRGEKPPEEVV